MAGLVVQGQELIGGLRGSVGEDPHACAVPLA
jgi:hypothetical protein